MSLALYRKYRSKSLDEVIGQAHITDILTRAIKADRIAHAYLLTGPKGVGKTSVARILAHQINQLPYTDDSTHLDIIEIDAASNNGVEDVRDLREKVQIAPVSARKKVYIIDEVHMLSKAAFNALLKTLEEPPEHIVFILATTDADKLPATIISRTQRYGFRAISEPDAVKHLAHIAKQEGIKIDEPALKLIAQRGDGSFRDSISLLDQLASLADNKEGVTAELIESTLGLAPENVITDIFTAVDAHDVTKIANLIQLAQNDGISAITLTQQLTLRLRDLIVEKPELVSLLDALLDVARNSQPSLKLLSVLGTAALERKPVKSAALSTPVLEVSATIEELTKQATRPKPRIKEEVDSRPSSAPRAQTLQPKTQSAREPDLSPGAKPLREGSGRKVEESKPFDWDALVEHARQNYVALYSVLTKCKYELADLDLTIYTNSKFYQKKLEDPKYSAHLYESLEALGVYQLTIHTLPTAPPPRGSQAAAIAAIMGGGEEVSLEAA